VLVCVEPEFVAWRPDFSSSEQASPHWTRVLCGEVELTNAINAVDWLDRERAVQVELCESCGFVGCASGGYVHVSRLESHVLWTPAHIDLSDPFEGSWYRPSVAVSGHGGVAIAVADWEAWRQQFPALPPAVEFPPTLRRDLLAAWRGEAQIFGQFDSQDDLVELARARAIAADPSSLEDALAQFEAVALWLQLEPDAPVEGALVRGAVRGARIETLYLDVPDTFDRDALREWRATALVNDRVTAVFSGELVLAPAPALIRA
jgi:hypothetical protein